MEDSSASGRGRNVNEKEAEDACICPDCPVQTDMHFGHEFYCTRGSEKELRHQ